MTKVVINSFGSGLKYSLFKFFDTCSLSGWKTATILHWHNYPVQCYNIKCVHCKTLTVKNNCKLYPVRLGYFCKIRFHQRKRTKSNPHFQTIWQKCEGNRFILHLFRFKSVIFKYDMAKDQAADKWATLLQNLYALWTHLSLLISYRYNFADLAYFLGFFKI